MMKEILHRWLRKDLIQSSWAVSFRFVKSSWKFSAANDFPLHL